MKYVFRFNEDDSFRSQRSTDFANAVLKAPATVRHRLSQSFGLSIQLNSDPIRTLSDGRKIGFGSFLSDHDTIHFVIAPKTETLRLKTLFEVLEESDYIQSVKFENISGSGPATEGDDDFVTYTFLLKLLDEIASSSVHLLNSVQEKKQTLVRGGIKGRPLLLQSVKNMTLGKSIGFVCEKLDDMGLRDQAIVLLATAKDVTRLLNEWENITGAEKPRSTRKIKRISVKFGNIHPSEFNYGMLYRVCRPPFPYGLRDVLYKCLQYWRWRGALRISEEGLQTFGYYGMYANLDILFQAYVGYAWRQILGSEYQWHPELSFPYEVGSDNKIIRPDHVFFSQESMRAIIIDAKYSQNIGSEKNIYQLIAYTNYTDMGNREYERIGILTYPGDGWQMRKIEGFNSSLFLVQMPVTNSLLENVPRDIIQRIDQMILSVSV